MDSVSTLMDGELNVDDAVREIVRLKADAELRENWDTYHLIGDVMRGTTPGRPGFGARFSEKLALEPTVLAPAAVVRAPRRLQNYALAAAASVAAVAVVSWVAYNPFKPDVPGHLASLPAVPAQQLAAAPVPAPAERQAAGLPSAAAPATDVRQAEVPAERMQEYLLAHQGISPSTAIQGVTPYIRTVSGSDE